MKSLSLDAILPLPIALVLALSGGCSGTGDRPDLGTVSGTITLDGAPLSGVGVTFVPEGLRGSFGFTDENGQYELTYLRDIKGAAVGTHMVSIDRIGEEGKQIENLPARYNTETELTREVEPGHNVIDFELTTEEPKDSNASSTP